MLLFIILSAVCVSISATFLFHTPRNAHYIFNINTTQEKILTENTSSSNGNNSSITTCIDRSKYKLDLLQSFGINKSTHKENDEYVLILGSGGLIGSHLKEKLLSKGYKVLHVQNRHHRDLRIPGSLSIFDDFNIKFVYFLAYEVGGAKYLQQDSIQDRILTSNIQMMDNVFEYLINRKLKFAFASSSLSADNSTYGVVKLRGERATMAHPELGRVFRLWNAYGFEPPGPRSHAVPDFALQCVRGGRLRALTDGREVRQFAHVADVAEALVLLMERFGRAPLSVDLSDGRWVSLGEVAAAVAAAVPGCVVELAGRPARKQARHEPVLGTEFHREWRCRVSLAEGVGEIVARTREYIAWAESHIAATFIIRTEEWNDEIRNDTIFVSERIEEIAKEFEPMKFSILLSVPENVNFDKNNISLKVVRGTLDNAISVVDSNITVITNTHTLPSFDHFVLIQHGGVNPMFLYHANVNTYGSREEAIKNTPKPDLAYFELCNECKNYSNTTVARSLSYVMATTDTLRAVGAPPSNISIHDWMMQLPSGYHSVQYEENVVGWGKEKVIEPNGKSCCNAKIE